MIYLIGGTPRCGKSTVAKSLAKQINENYFQTDYIHSALNSKMNDGVEFDLFGPKYVNKENWVNNDIRFSVFTNKEQIGFYEKKAQWAWQGIENIVEYMLANEEGYVIEGYHLRPELVHNTLGKRGSNVKYIVLYKSNIKEIEYGLRQNDHPNDWAVKKTFDESTFPKIASFIYDFGQCMKNSADALGLESYDMSTGTFESNINRVQTKILKI